MNAFSNARVFNAVFARTEHTVCIGGADEPRYFPPEGAGPHRAILRYTYDHPRSALHEIAHWCIAGRARRQCPDFGYWYRPPPRHGGEQAAFYRAEAPAQALEAIFTEACGLNFEPSADQLGVDAGGFRQQITETRARFAAAGLPPRARRFLDALERP